MKTQFAKRLCQSYQRKCQRLNQAIILCYKTLQIAFQTIPGISLAWVKYTTFVINKTLLSFETFAMTFSLANTCVLAGYLEKENAFTETNWRLSKFILGKND